MKTPALFALIAAGMIPPAAAVPESSIRPFQNVGNFRQDARDRSETVTLPQVRVEASLRFDRDNDRWLAAAGYNRMVIRRHLSEFDAEVLNRFTLPLLGIPREVRAREVEALVRNRANSAAINVHVRHLREVDPAAAAELVELRRSTLGR